MKRNAVSLSSSLERGLKMYTLSACASGVGMLALAQPAEARIIYARAHHEITSGYPYALDLNQNGIRDFLLSKNGIYTTYRSTAKLWMNYGGLYDRSPMLSEKYYLKCKIV